jgi:hypothetical protein
MNLAGRKNVLGGPRVGHPWSRRSLSDGVEIVSLTSSSVVPYPQKDSWYLFEFEAE